MKKLFIAFSLVLMAGWAAAQKNPDPLIFTGNTTLQQEPLQAADPNGPHIYLQIGGAIQPTNTALGDSNTLHLRYPWDVLNLALTFEESYYDVSKGYFSDKIAISWNIRANAARITQLRVHRRVYDEANLNDTDNYEVIATLSSDSYNYDDFNTQGGVLYEYKVEAVGVSSLDIKYISYITGIGFRNPTGVVTGNISYEGGNPVKDVVVRAEPQGATLAFGNSLVFNGTSRLLLPLPGKQLNTSITLQAWVKLTANTTGTLFRLQDVLRTTDEVLVAYSTTDSSLTLSTAITGGGSTSVTLSDYYPTGNIDGRGDDTFNAFTDLGTPATDFAANFIHITAVLNNNEEPLFYINGRPLTSNYVDSLPAYLPVKPVVSTAGTYTFQGFETAYVRVGEGLQGNLDEIRLWSKALPATTVRTDFKRYLGGGEANLIAYLRCDEGVGFYAYDISKVGYSFNKNHARVVNATWTADKPTASQLGILGVTDEQGNYIISAIPYSGTGESYTITPTYGVHQFEPAQQLGYLGKGSEVLNKINFKDISAFDFMGVVYYTTEGVFDPIAPVADVTPGSVTETGYNQYNAIISGTEQLLSKGSYLYKNDTLFETPRVFVPGANVYIDGQMVLDKDNRPVVTDEQGFFKVSVPIGNHYIEVKKDKHYFMHAGRFPAAREDGNDLFEFFEHQQAAVTFLDSTRVILAGRVVGGAVEADKPLGFGYNGPLKEEYPVDSVTSKTVNISSVNNIGQAVITFSYLPFGGTPGIGELEYAITTNPETGEYFTRVLPLNYTVYQSGGVRIPGNPSLQLLNANETVNMQGAVDPQADYYVNAAGDTVYSEPFHFSKSFIYRSTPVLNVIEQGSDLQVDVIKDMPDGTSKTVSISTEGFPYPVYTQLNYYAIDFETYEEYINYDGGAEEVTQVPVTDGKFIITNNLALEDTETYHTNPDNPSITRYIFRAGLPSISPPFTRTINIKYQVNGQEMEALNYHTEGIILGGRSDGSQTFVTKGPDYPDIILRDPPGSNSYASIQSGTSISFNETMELNIAQKADQKVEMKLGYKVELGGGLAGPVIASETVNTVKGGLQFSVESTNGSSVKKTYTFNETISTSSDPAFVGSMADLYIGNSKNYYYGSYDNLRASSVRLDEDPHLKLVNNEGDSLFISKQKGFYFSEEPTSTFFIYTQQHILDNVIPELEGIIEAIDKGSITEKTDGVLSRKFYVEQIRQWQSVIQDNERTKYLAVYERESYKSRIENNLEGQIDSLNNYIKTIAGIGGVLAYTGPNYYGNVGLQAFIDGLVFLEQKKGLLEQKLDFVSNGFEKNVSFDAGVGEYTNSFELAEAVARTKVLKLDIEQTYETTFGFKLNNTGFLLHSSFSANQTLNTALETEESNTSTISYTLSDSDPGNFISVDVINAFDGNGPVFSVIGGRTSCPYEGIDTTLFYNHSEYSYATDTAGLILSGGEQISFATQQIEVPMISVTDASVIDVPEEKAAEFTLILENNSPTELDATYLLYIDNTTNPNNAITNIPPNGVAVSVPYGQQVEYALTLEKSISDVYEYKDIDIVLSSLCDGTISDRVTVSAVFRPSCTAVDIENPLNNWVFNAGDAYNPDNSTNPLNINMFGYNRNYNSFEKFNLEYRRNTSSSWTRLRTYYNTAELLDAAQVNGEDKGVLIEANVSSYAWDIGKLGLADGTYELRAVSQCANGTDYISDVITGTIDLNVPVQFGTPTPTDGILGAGEDLQVRFSEDVMYNSAISKIEIKGVTNQQEVNHNVSVHFEGAENTVTIERPSLPVGDISLEFWLQNQTTGTGVLFDQLNGFKLTLNNGTMAWTLNGAVLSAALSADQQFHHYTLTYNAAARQMSIYEDDRELAILTDVDGLTQVNNNPLVIGGNSWVGNMHDLRLWSKPLSLAEAYVAQFNELTGFERDLIGYWPMNEGAGDVVRDLARYNHGLLKADWDIKPKGTSYNFANNQYLVLDDIDFVQIPAIADITLSFWLKTADRGNVTVFANGRGNGEDLVQSNGYANKWAVSLRNGILELHSEGQTYNLSSTDLADNSWHHIAIVLRRTGALKTYIDAELESSNPVAGIGGLSGNKIWVGARGFTDAAFNETVDQVFTGKIDGLRLWNLARATEQIERDRFNEVDFNAIGLLLYARMNQPDPVTGDGPKYYRQAANETVLPANARLSSGPVNYTTDAPPVKLQRPYLSFEVRHVINGDEMIITPLINDWAALEGQIIDITVDRMFDVYGNRQASPITWSAFVRRNEVSWFVAGGGQQLSIEKQVNEPYTFEVTLLNKGGRTQPYRIENIPGWLHGNSTSGTLAPNSSKTIEFSVDPDLAVGTYVVDLYLDTDFDFDERIVLNLRVMGQEPDWTVIPGDFEYSMNIIGKVKLNDVFVEDPFTKLAAFAGNEIRGVANLEYDSNYDEYFLYLSVFSNTSAGDEITFKIWDATAGKTYQATIDGQPAYTFIQNEVLGYKAAPVIFANTSLLEQHLELNQGWTWISVFAEDPDLPDLNQLTTALTLTTNDMIKSQVSFDVYDNITGWNGSLTAAGGLTTNEMYKVKLGNANTLILSGNEVDAATWSASLKDGWNWLAYPLSNNIAIAEALALLQASEGDIIKNQRAFAVYDPVVGWSGTLNYLQAGEGYMLKSGISQTFSYPNTFAAGRFNNPQKNSVVDFAGWNLYESNLNVVAEVPADEPYTFVWARDQQGNVRGKAEIIDVNGRRLSYLTVFGNPGIADEIVLYLGNEQIYTATTTRFVFTPDLILGNIKNPVLLEIGSAAGVKAYPNAFSKEFNLRFMAIEAQQTEVVLMDTQGRTVYQQTINVNKGANDIHLAPEVPKGLYFISISLDGVRNTIKVIRQ